VLRVLDPALRRMTAPRAWRGVEDSELDERIAELPRAPAPEPVRGERAARWSMTPSKR
jgi:hypothetical protein